MARITIPARSSVAAMSTALQPLKSGDTIYVANKHQFQRVRGILADWRAAGRIGRYDMVGIFYPMSNRVKLG